MAKYEELITSSHVDVGLTNVEVSRECYQQRSGIVITNISTGGQVISIGIGTEAVLGEGIVLYQGGVYQDNRDNNYTPSNKQINAISSLAGGIIAVQERITMKSGY